MPSIAHIPIEPEETLSRFILKEKWKKLLPGGGIRYEAFLPYSRVELSVTPGTRAFGKKIMGGRALCSLQTHQGGEARDDRNDRAVWAV